MRLIAFICFLILAFLIPVGIAQVHSDSPREGPVAQVD